jgi:hypothetical protein
VETSRLLNGKIASIFKGHTIGIYRNFDVKRDDFTFPRGARIGGDKVSCLIGEGGFSRVYKFFIPGRCLR